MNVDVRTRAGFSRSRNGCRTCKIRRVKCDESRPKCQRCTISGHECQFDNVLSTGEATSVTFINYTPGPSQSHLKVYPDADRQELRALDFFLDRSVSDIPGQVYTELWSRYLTPLAHQEPALRHAMVALGSLHEGYLNSSMDNQYALRHYGKAIDLVTKLDPSSPGALDIALASCVLFAAIETLIGHPKNSVMHVLAGMKILKQGGRPTDGYIPQDQLSALFDRTACQALEIGDLNTLSQSSPPTGFSIPETFASTQEALRSLEAFQYFTLRSFQEAAIMFDTAVSAEAQLALLAPTLKRFQTLAGEWSAACERFLASTTKPDHPSHLILRIMIEATYIQLNAPREGDFDQYTSRFKQIADWAETYLCKVTTRQPPGAGSQTPWVDKQILLSTTTSPLAASTRSNTPTAGSQGRHLLPKPEPVMRPTFTMSSGVIPYLYMVTARCRDPGIRRQALRLLSTSNRREGLWDSQLTALVAERVMLIEEHNARCILGLEDSEPLTDCSQIPLSARITVTGTQFGQNREGIVTYASRDPNSPVMQMTERIYW